VNQLKNGLAKAKELYLNRGQRARELHAQGRTVLGFLCLFAPPEIVAAAEILPYRLTGDQKEPPTAAHRYVEPFGCPYVRNLFDQDLKNKNDFIDGIIMSHSCDMVQRCYGIWTYHKKHTFQYFVNVPHTTEAYSREFYKGELRLFREKMEEISHVRITDQKLRELIGLYNQNRALLRTLYDLRKEEPPLISGTEVLEIMVAGMGLPVVEFNFMLEDVIAEIQSRKDKPIKKDARILFYGCVSDDLSFVKLVEECGANVVTDDTCIGTRSFLHDVPDSADPIDGLVSAYFDTFMCPRTSHGNNTSRFQYMLDLTQEFKVNGVIMYLYSFCDPHKFDVPDIQRLLQQQGIPFLVIDDDYTLSNMAGIRTRVQAFTEMV